MREYVDPDSGLERIITMRAGRAVVVEVRCIWEGKRWITKVERLSDGSFRSSTGTALRSWGERHGSLDEALDQLPLHVQASWRSLFLADLLTEDEIQRFGFIQYTIIVE